MPNQMYKIYMHAVLGVPAGYYGDVPGVSMNKEIYCRVDSIDKATEFTRHQAIHFVMNAKWPCHCEPPITITL